MTRNTTRFAVVLLALLVAGAVALPAVAVSDPREEPADTRPPVRVYVSETIDISSVQLSGDGTVGTESTTFTAVGGGSSFTVDPSSADFDGIAPGAYYATSDSDIKADLWVVRPQVTELELRNGKQTDVTGRSVDAENLQRMSIRASYNFVEADRLDVTVVGPSGNDVATGRITESRGRTTVSLDDPAPGIHTVTVTGSNIEAGTRTATVRVRGAATTATPAATETSTPAPTATATATATATPEPATATATATATPEATPTEGDGPGFGVIATLLAVLVTALVARRRR